MTIEFILLRDHPELLPIVAEWYFREWGVSHAGRTLADEQQRLRPIDPSDAMPMVLMAMEAGVPVGAARIKRHERLERLEREFWLGGVYVVASHRGHGIAGRIIGELMSRAVTLGIRDVYLQTKADDGGLYRRLGWLPLESVMHERGYPVRILCRTLESGAA